MRNRCGDLDVIAGRHARGCHPEAQGQRQGEGKQKHRDEMAHARVPANLKPVESVHRGPIRKMQTI